MKVTLFGTLFLVTGLICLAAATAPSVELYGIEEAGNVFNSNEYVLAFFFEPWCETCDLFEPIFASINEELAKVSPPIKCIRVNVSERTEARAFYGILSYPHLTLLFKGYPVHYQANLKHDLILKWVAKTVAQSLVPLVPERILL